MPRKRLMTKEREKQGRGTAASKRDIRKRTVLVADDSKLIQNFVRSRLPTKQFKIIFAHNGKEALQKARRSKPDLVLLDVILPEINGIDVCKRLKSHTVTRGTPVILLSSNDDIQEKVIGLDSGADDFMVKPLHEEELKARINAQLRLRSLQEELEEKNRILEKLSITDDLTKMFTRNYFFQRLAEEMQRALRYGHRFALAMFDLDNFKHVNDIFGHKVGDSVLEGVSGLLRGNIRNSDLACRYGGEEFVLLLLESSAIHAKIVAERIRESIEKMRVSSDHSEAQVTISCGIIEFPGPKVESPMELVHVADKVLYQAKAQGKNRVVIFSP